MCVTSLILLLLWTDKMIKIVSEAKNKDIWQRFQKCIPILQFLIKKEDIS